MVNLRFPHRNGNTISHRSLKSLLDRLTKPNLSVHLSKLEEAGLIEIEKTYRGRVPLTLCRMTEKGQESFGEYLDQLKNFVERSTTP
jgi:DNA-binding transcriptional ArsR family regulator